MIIMFMIVCFVALCGSHFSISGSDKANASQMNYNLTQSGQQNTFVYRQRPFLIISKHNILSRSPFICLKKITQKKFTYIKSNYKLTQQQRNNNSNPTYMYPNFNAHNTYKLQQTKNKHKSIFQLHVICLKINNIKSVTNCCLL